MYITRKKHKFKQSMSYPDGEGCAHIVKDYPNSTTADPIRCRMRRESPIHASEQKQKAIHGVGEPI